jgi:hypothetical protein
MEMYGDCPYKIAGLRSPTIGQYIQKAERRSALQRLPGIMR